jgi:GH24 family phage-related lysozyme (muramidase)
MNRKPIFDAVRTMLGRGFTQAEVDALDEACAKAEGALPAGKTPKAAPAAAPAPAAAGGRSLGSAGAALIKKWEGCEHKLPDGRFRAYPDPGSSDGLPWTIGWGSTGPDVKKDTVWTQAQCDARFDEDMKSYCNEVSHAIGGAPTTQNQFDALVAFHYNTGKIGSATLTKLHKQGKYAQAKNEFGKWIYNAGKPMQGLRNRRRAEAELYAKP